MLDGLKMEENFQSAIETSASFSSLLGEYSGHAPGRTVFPPGPSSGAQLPWTRSAIGELAARFTHSVEPTHCLAVSLCGSFLPLTDKPPQASRIGHRTPQSREGRARLLAGV